VPKRAASWLCEGSSEVRTGQACHGDAPVKGHVHVPLVCHVLYLGPGQARETEHANLLQDVGPVARGADCNATTAASQQGDQHVQPRA
jgi:hypothetical protein